jgi:hypothetical protein
MAPPVPVRMEDSLMHRPAQSFPPYKDLVVLTLSDPSAEAITAQKLTAALKRKWPGLDFKKKLWQTALSKAVDTGVVKQTNNGPKWGGAKYSLTKAGAEHLERAIETETRRKSREEVDESRPPVDAQDTPFAGWLMRTYFMADGGELKHYLPPRLLPSQPSAEASASADEEAESKGASGPDGAAIDDHGSGEDEADGDEVEKVLDKRISEQGVQEYKVRWKGYTAEDDTW